MKRPTRRQAPWRSLWPAAMLAAAALTLACDSSVNFTPTTPNTPSWLSEARLAMVSGNNQVGMAGQPLDAPFVVRVVGKKGHPVSGAVVVWDILEGDGDLPSVSKGPQKLSYETKTDTDGVVSIVLTLGSRPGRNVVESKLMFGSGSATFVATGMVGG